MLASLWVCNRRLAIVTQGVAAMQGTVRIVRSSADGTKFVATLPVQDHDAA